MQRANNKMGQSHSITVFCDQGRVFDRNLAALVKQWDKQGNINILPASLSNLESSNSARPNQSTSLQAVDENGVKWTGAEAVPIIFKNLPFGKIAAAMYILPGTMWVTKQLYEMEAPR